MGLSPRVRGNLKDFALAVHLQGSIPACAGEPFQAPHDPRKRRVYPRVCGGTFLWICAAGESTGLSPRVRGNQKASQGQAFVVGSIPACAGEPVSGPSRAPGSRVYPRVCGGTNINVFTVLSALGLSPRVRGNPPSSYAHTSQIGSIPACAGEP